MLVLKNDPPPRPVSSLFRCRYSHSRQQPVSARCSRWALVSAAGSSGTKSVDQICPCGCGLLAPIMAPRFSKICTYSIQSSAAQSLILPSPTRPPRANLLARHARQGQRVVGMIAEHLAQPPRGLCLQQRRSPLLRRARGNPAAARRNRLQKKTRPLYAGFTAPPARCIPRAQIALRIVRDARGRGLLPHFALPRPLGAMRRNQHPRLPQRIPAPMRRLTLQVHACSRIDCKVSRVCGHRRVPQVSTAETTDPHGRGPKAPDRTPAAACHPCRTAPTCAHAQSASRSLAAPGTASRASRNRPHSAPFLVPLMCRKPWQNAKSPLTVTLKSRESISIGVAQESIQACFSLRSTP
jgi:hypothetical protein